jgi:hypothetical protein
MEPFNFNADNYNENIVLLYKNLFKKALNFASKYINGFATSAIKRNNLDK